MDRDTKNLKNRISKENLVEDLERAIDAENTTSICYKHLASLIKNGRIRNKFYSFSEAARLSKDFLTSRLGSLGKSDFVLEEKCTFCKINPESFSLEGAINLGLEITKAAADFYKRLLGLSRDEEYRKLFKKLLSEKSEQRNFLKKEKRFISSRGDKLDIIEDYCIPEVISSLWK